MKTQDHIEFEKMMEQIKPFIKKGRFTSNSTRGKWIDSDTLMQRSKSQKNNRRK